MTPRLGDVGSMLAQVWSLLHQPNNQIQAAEAYTNQFLKSRPASDSVDATSFRFAYGGGADGDPTAGLSLLHQYQFPIRHIIGF